MNRKESKEQNDTSIIIGNLPKRLQRKFAESCLDNTENGFGKQSVSRSTISNREKRDDVAFAGCLKVKTNTMGTNSANERCSLKQKNTNSTESKKNGCVLPGVLRINGANCLDPYNEKGERQFVEQERKSSPLFRQDYLLKDMIPISPARIPLKQPSQPLWFQLLDDIPVAKDLPQLYESLMSLLRRNVVLLEWDYFREIHNDLMQVFTDMMLHHLKFVCEQKVDTFFWKILYYNIREHLKTQLSQEATEIILSIIENGNVFYKRLHDLLVKKYLQRKVCGEQMRKYEFIAKVADQKIFICLGDLSRYRAKHLQMLDYSEAFKYYQEAQRLIPTNAIPYNQLAIVSLHAKKQFDAVYFHMRSLMSSNPIASAKESLLVLFDEIRKKYEESESKTTPRKNNYKRKDNKRRNSSSFSMRKEIWVHPDGAKRLHRTEVKDEDDDESSALQEDYQLKDLTKEETTKRFISLYLYVVGKLYSGIGMESIEPYEKKLFTHLHLILKSEPILIKRNRLLKIVALNIFLVEHNKLKESRKEIRYLAFLFACQFFGFILKTTNAILDDQCLYLHNRKDQLKFYDLNTLLQFVRIYMKWLLRNVEIWEPIRSPELSVVDCWLELNVFFKKLKETSIKIQEEGHVIDNNVVFEEDNLLLGFTPLSISFNKHESIQEPSDEVSQFFERIRQIADFQELFKENETLLFKENNTGSSSLLTETVSNFVKVSSDSDEMESNDENDLKKAETNYVNNSPKSSSNPDESLSELAKLKKELEAKNNKTKIYNEKLQEILNFIDLKLQIEVRPKYLLPDTNCFIDYLDDFERIVKDFKCFSLIVPLTVVKELDGLSKGYKSEDKSSMEKHRIHHYDDVSTRATKSLEFIKSSKNCVRCATSKGSILNASLFGLVEEDYASNDDKILATALALSKTMSNEIIKDGKCFIHTELVLITTDRNLRVKALSRNLAVCELKEFLQWAKDCKK